MNEENNADNQKDSGHGTTFNRNKEQINNDANNQVNMPDRKNEVPNQEANPGKRNAYQRGVDAAKSIGKSFADQKLNNFRQNHPGLSKAADTVGNIANGVNALRNLRKNPTNPNEAANQANTQGKKEGTSTGEGATENKKEGETKTENTNEKKGGLGGFGAGLGATVGAGIASKAKQSDNALVSGTAKAASGVKKIVKFFKKYPQAIPPTIVGLKVLVVLFLAGFLIYYALTYANIFMDKAFDALEITLNFTSGAGFRTNNKLIIDAIEQAAGTCEDCLFPGTLVSSKGLDKGILYATANNQVIVGNDVYENANDDTVDGKGGLDVLTNSFVTKVNERTFYDMKANLIGTPKTMGKAIYSLIGEEIAVECVSSASIGKLELYYNNANNFAKYYNNAILVAVPITFTVGDNGSVTTPTPEEMVDEASFAAQGSDYLYNTILTMEQALDDNPVTAAMQDWKNFKTAKKACMYNNDGTKRTDENGNEMVAKYVTQKINDYQTYYNYIKRVYVPTIYYSVWSSYSEQRKKEIVNETWADIVNARNAYYDALGESNYLSYRIEDNGTILTTTSPDASMSYISPFSVGDPASVALTWRQGGKFYWADKEYDKGYTMRRTGCYITAISKLVKLSGTKINNTSFDPWIFAQSSKFKSGNLVANSWTDLVPNFTRIAGPYVNISSTSLNPSTELERAMNQNGHVGDNLYYTIYIEYYKGEPHHHFIAIVGKDENGFILSDSAYGGNTYHLNDIKTVINSTVKITGYQVYRKTD